MESMPRMRNRIRKSSLRVMVLFGACSGGSRDASAFAPSHREHLFRESEMHRPRRHSCRRQHHAALSVAGTKRPRVVDVVISDTSDETHLADQPKKPKITFGLLPDFMQKDPLAVTKQKWTEQTTNSDDIEEEKSASEKRSDTEMMAMSAFSIALAIGVVYALASSAPDMIEPKEISSGSENMVRDLMREGNMEKLEFATRNIVDTVLPQSAEDVIAVSIGEGIAGAIGAFATWLLGMLLNFKSDEDFIVTPVNGGMDNNVDVLVSEAVADGDYFFTRAAAEPLFEALGVPVFFASLASVLIATIPYEAVKVTSQRRRSDINEKLLLDLLLEEEEMRKSNTNVVDRVSNNFFEFFQKLNVRANIDDDFEEDFDDEEPDTSQLQQQDVPPLDYVELFADITKWLEYDVLITNFRGILELPNGQMLSTGWESAIFGLLAALSSQLYTDVLYLYSDFGNPLKREKTLNRSIEGWASVYATKCLSAATLFGVYEAVRAPTSRFLSQLVSGGVAGCTGSEEFDLCMETYLVDNPPDTLEADFRAFVVSITHLGDNLSWILPLNDQETFASFARGTAVSLYSVLAKVFDM